MAETVDYRSVLDDLRTKHAALAQAIEAVETILATGAVTDSAAAPVLTRGGIQPDTFIGLNLTQAAEKYLRLVGRPERTSVDIQEALERGGLKISLGSVSTTLLRNHNEGIGGVVRANRGLWGLSEWYAHRPPRTSNRRAVVDEEPEPEAAPASGFRPTLVSSGDPTKKKATTNDLVLEVLRSAGRPLRAEEITGQVNARGSAATQATVEGQLARWAKKGTVVRKTAPRTYAAM